MVLAAIGGIAYAVAQSQEGGTIWQAGRQGGGSGGFGGKLPREDAVLVFGATGRMGRTVVQEVSWVRCSGASALAARADSSRATFHLAAGATHNWASCRLPLLPLLPRAQLLAQGRTVVAAVRSPGRARDVFGKAGLVEGRQPGGAGILFVESGVDITNPDTLSPLMFEGVSQVVTAVGAVFGRTAEGQMG